MSGNTGTTGELYLRDVLDLPEAVLSGAFKVELSGGFTDTAERVAEYVVTDQLEKSFRKALTIVRESVRRSQPNAAYLHGSFGSGKSHFMTVLHAVLSGHPAARAKPRLQPIIADHDEWLRDRKFLMVPYHLVGSTTLDSAILGGYVAAVRRLHPEAPVPPVYRADSMLDDARRQREFFKDDAKFAEWLGSGAAPTPQPTIGDGDDDLPDLDAHTGVWTSADLDRAFAAPPGDPARNALISALLSGPMPSYARGAAGDKDAFLPLEDGLAIIAEHAKSLGYDALVLFLDELILWLQAHLSNREMVNDEVNKLVKLIESGTGPRALPIVSFISRQRDLSKLIGVDVVGADVKNLEQQVKYLAERIDTIPLEDRNLPAIVRERVLKPKNDAAAAALADAFARVESSNQSVREVLLDSGGATDADWEDFRSLYPFSPALLNVLVALSGALQRERTGLRLLKEMLYRRRADMKLGQLIPIGDLWDVLSEGMAEAFTDQLRSEAEAATRFHEKVRAHLLGKYGSEDDPRYRADDRFVKTLLLAYLAPQVPALTRLTGARISALNHGELKSRTGQTGRMVTSRLQDLQGVFPGELRSDGAEDPVFTLHLSDLDVEPLLEAVGDVDTVGARKVWVREKLWQELGLRDGGEFVTEKEVVWHGTRRVAEFVFENVADRASLPDVQFQPSVAGRVRFVIDYPFSDNHPLSDDVARIEALRRTGQEAPTVVWLPSFVSPQRAGQLGRLLKIDYLLGRDRIKDFAPNRAADDHVRMKHQLEAQRETLNLQLAAVLKQAYGISKPVDGDLGEEVVDGRHVHSLLRGHNPQLMGGGTFAQNMLGLADGIFAALYPKHPNFDLGQTRQAVTPAQFRKVYDWIAKAMEDGSRRVVVDKGDLLLVKRVVHALELGEVHDGPLNLGTEWRRLIDQQAGVHGVRGDVTVEDIRTWIGEIGWTGLDKIVGNLVIATYALLADRSWVFNGSPRPAPALDQIGPGWALRAQELPSEEEFATAHARAGAIFAASRTRPVMLARNVGALADEIRDKVGRWENAVNGLRRSLERHRAGLGVTADGPTARERSVRDAADLLARLQAKPDATALVRELAAARYDSTDTVLGSTMASAQDVLDALDATEWRMLASLAGFTGRGDGLSDRVERLLAEIAEAAAEDEFSRKLAPVLRAARGRAVELIAEGGRLAAAARPVAPADVRPEEDARRALAAMSGLPSDLPPDEAVRRAAAALSGVPTDLPPEEAVRRALAALSGPPPGPQSPTIPAPADESPDQGADGVSLTLHGQPPLSTDTREAAAPDAAAPATPRRRRSARITASPSRLEAELARVVADLQREVRAHAAAHPDADIEIDWDVHRPQPGTHGERTLSPGNDPDDTSGDRDR